MKAKDKETLGLLIEAIKANAEGKTRRKLLAWLKTRVDAYCGLERLG